MKNRGQIELFILLRKQVLIERDFRVCAYDADALLQCDFSAEGYRTAFRLTLTDKGIRKLNRIT